MLFIQEIVEAAAGADAHRAGAAEAKWAGVCTTGAAEAKWAGVCTTGAADASGTGATELELLVSMELEPPQLSRWWQWDWSHRAGADAQLVDSDWLCQDISIHQTLFTMTPCLQWHSSTWWQLLPRQRIVAMDRVHWIGAGRRRPGSERWRTMKEVRLKWAFQAPGFKLSSNFIFQGEWEAWIQSILGATGEVKPCCYNLLLGLRERARERDEKAPISELIILRVMTNDWLLGASLSLVLWISLEQNMTCYGAKCVCAQGITKLFFLPRPRIESHLFIQPCPQALPVTLRQLWALMTIKMNMC